MEQLIVLLIFAVCAMVCVKIFVYSHLMAVDTYDLNNALAAAKNGAECFKATGGDIEKAAEILNGEYVFSAAAVYFDAEWKPCGVNDAVYTMSLKPQDSERDRYPILCELSVEKTNGGALIAFTVAGRVSNEQN